MSKTLVPVLLLCLIVLSLQASKPLHAPIFRNLLSASVPALSYEISSAFIDQSNQTLYAVSLKPMSLMTVNIKTLEPKEYARLDSDKKLTCFLTRNNRPCCITVSGDSLLLTCFSSKSLSEREATVPIEGATRILGDIPIPVASRNGFYLSNVTFLHLTIRRYCSVSNNSVRT
jgi:hypothetical protein